MARSVNVNNTMMPVRPSVGGSITGTETGGNPNTITSGGLTTTRKGGNDQSVRSFLSSPKSVFGLPDNVNPGHLLPSTDFTGSPPPATKAAKASAWNWLASNWTNGFTVLSRPRSSLQ
jgi:hypothetical protein